MTKIVTVIGARPQLIKASVVSKAFRESGKITEVMVHTGQHYDANMRDIFFEQMKLSKPSYQLDINQSTHGDLTGRMLIEIEKILMHEKPDWMLVYGDTDSTLAGALAASKLHIKIAHIEAGLRSYNMRMPEEVNRLITDRVSSILFCPTRIAEENLRHEGYGSGFSTIIQSGDVMYDAALYFRRFEPSNEKVKQIIEQDRPFVLATIHREENTNDKNKLQSIFSGLDEVNKRMQVIMPLHPRTKKLMQSYSMQTNITLIEPIGYIEMLKLIEKSQLVITDSGGLQKEAYFLGKYCLTAREETEWLELVENGYNVLVGANKELILEMFDAFRNKSFENTMNLYGNGNASSIITKVLANR
jgi:UDP-GlcNAc3NAcA epimerase